MLGSFFKKKRKKVVVLGLDGVPFSLLKKFAEEGVMPNVRTLLDEGTLCDMSVSMPEVSSTSWSTFMTGVNPGRHGIYGFMELQKNSYGWKFPNFNDLKSKTLWDIAGDSGKKSIVLNIPSTYPAQPLNGMLVAGFVALDLKKASYPDRLYQYLLGISYKLDVDAGKAVHAIHEFTQDILHTFKKRVEAINYLYENEDWDLFIAVVTETDRLHHYLWAALEDVTHPQHEFFIDFYRELDNFIGDFRKKIGPGVPFIMLSDHGFAAIKKEVYLNRFLVEKGYLKFNTANPESFEDMDADSSAFALDPSRIYIHLKNRYKHGSVSDGDYAQLRIRLKSDLLAIRDDGNKVIKEVNFKEDIYSGACLGDAPDLVLLPFEGYDLKGAISKKELFGRGLLTGGHTRGNALFYINRKIDCIDPNIVDVGVTVLKLLGVETEQLDGNSLVD